MGRWFRSFCILVVGPCLLAALSPAGAPRAAEPRAVLKKYDRLSP